MKITLQEISQIVEGKLIGDGNIVITGVGDIELAQPGELSFIKDERFKEKVYTTKASGVIVPLGTGKLPVATIEVPNPYLSFVKILNIIYLEKRTFYRGIHKTAILGKNVQLGKDVSIGAYTVVGDNVVLGDNTVICCNVYIGDNVKIGNNTFIYPNVSIREDTVIGNNVIIHCGSVIGSDGFGFLPEAQKYIKIPQVGKVIIEDDVEIGANVAIDRATVGITLIGKGTKIDNLVHIAHNVTIGENSILLAHVTIGGSTKIGKHAIFSGQTGVINGLKIGDNVTAAARTGILEDVPDNSIIWGMPAGPLTQQKKIFLSLRKLPEMVKKVKLLEQKLELLEKEIKSIKK